MHNRNIGKFRLLPVAAALVLMVSWLWSFPVRAAVSRLSDYTSEQSADGWYVHTFKGSRYYFLSSAGRGTVSIYPVTVVVPSGVRLSGTQALAQAQAENTASGMSYIFKEAGTHSLTVTAPEEDGVVRYGKFYFTILASSETDGVSAGLTPSDSNYHVIKHSSGATYSTDIQEGEVLTRPGVVLTGAGMKCEVIYNSTKSAYTSGEKLTRPGTYQMIFTSSILGREEKSALNFSIGEIQYREPEDYSVHFPVDPSKSVNTNLADVGTPNVGGWSWDSSLKSDLEDWGNGSRDDSGEDRDYGSEGGLKGGSEGKSEGGSFESGTKEKEITVLGTGQAEIKPLKVQLVSSSDRLPDWETSEEDAYTGPGAVEETEEETEPPAPKEVLVELSERYNEDYKIYELSFANKYFFYSNLGDGGITSRSKPAVFDVPANITVVMEKDGIPAPYNNKAAISEPGTYVFYLSVPDGLDPETEEKVIYKAVYHFRVEEKEPETQAPSESGLQGGGYYGFGRESFLQGGTDNAAGKASQAAGEGLEDAAADDTTGSGTDGSESGKGDGDGLKTEDREGTDNPQADENFTGLLNEDSTMEDIDALVDELTKPDGRTGNGAFSSDSPTGIRERYDSAQQMYAQELISGTVFYSSVPNGMITYGQVAFSIPEGLTVVAQKDDQPYEFTPDTPIQEAGEYRLEFRETKVDYTLNYDMPPYFIFRIIDGPVSDLEIFNAPVHFAITYITKDEKPISVRYNDWAALDADGTYRIEIVSDLWGKQYTVELEKDTVAPQASLTGVENGVSTGTSVTIEPLSEDIKQIEVYRNGSRDEEYHGGAITNSGNYRVMVYDQAGNVSQYSFRMKYKMNVASIISVVLVILLGTGIAVYVKKVKKDVRVR